MKTRKQLLVPAGAVLLALVLSGSTTTAMAQTPTPAPAKPPMHQDSMKEMKAMSSMSGMKDGPHHVLAMAYRDNLVTFARVLQGPVARSKTVDLDVARPVVVEMRRSFDQMQQHHGAQMTMMGDHMTPGMTEMKQDMETHLSKLAGHLSALELEVNGSGPDPKKVSEHTTAILKQCAEMSAKPHSMK